MGWGKVAIIMAIVSLALLVVGSIYAAGAPDGVAANGAGWITMAAGGGAGLCVSPLLAFWFKDDGDKSRDDAGESVAFITDDITDDIRDEVKEMDWNAAKTTFTKSKNGFRTLSALQRCILHGVKRHAKQDKVKELLEAIPKVADRKTVYYEHLVSTEGCRLDGNYLDTKMKEYGPPTTQRVRQFDENRATILKRATGSG